MDNHQGDTRMTDKSDTTPEPDETDAAADSDDVVRDGYEGARHPEAQGDGDPAPLDEAPTPEE
jgi:hypothetical protein